MTEEEQEAMLQDIDDEMDKIPSAWTFSDRMALRLDGDGHAVATLAGYNDGMMAVASQIVGGPGPERSLERCQLAKIAFRLSRTAANQSAWTARPMPYTLVDGRQIMREEEVPSAERIRRVEVFGTDEAVRRYGNIGADGAVLITTKPENVSTVEDVEREVKQGAGMMSAESADEPPHDEAGKGYYGTVGLPTVEQDELFHELLEKYEKAGDKRLCSNLRMKWNRPAD